ncbi:MAG: DUF4956 domain-containing protein [Hyphomonadaceae bacterium]|nr:DUF4956 domain-containing protein [Hyphomonadaceae bacterium]
MFGMETQQLPSIGWAGFMDGGFLMQAVLSLLLATALGAFIGFHPTTQRTVDTRAEAELPKVMIMYALVGAVIGELVLKYGMVVGFVVFGLGGLMRFRTDTASTRDTGRLIIVTLLGLVAGLNLPHFAVIAAVFAWVLIFWLDGHPIFELEVHEIPKGRMKDAATAYRSVLGELKCSIVSENKSFSKHRIDYVFRAPRRITHAELHQALCERVPHDVRGEIDWEVE